MWLFSMKMEEKNPVIFINNIEWQNNNKAKIV